MSQALSFTATVANDSGNQGVTWSVMGPGTLSAQAATTATLTGTAAGAVVVTATSNADTTKSASATIGVTDLAGERTEDGREQRAQEERGQIHEQRASDRAGLKRYQESVDPAADLDSIDQLKKELARTSTLLGIPEKPHGGA